MFLAERIYFPDEIVPKKTSPGLSGNATDVDDISLTEFGIDYDILLSKLLNISNSEHQLTSKDRNHFPDEIIEVAVTAPPGSSRCRTTYWTELFFYAVIKTQAGSESVHIYHLNETAEELISKGFKIIVNKVMNGDVLSNFSYSNGTFKGNLAYESIAKIAFAIGGVNSPLLRSYYMAQIGEKHGDVITWLCDGVLINQRWILSAAHCFVKPGVNPNVVRLGDYDLSDPNDSILKHLKKVIRDYPIDKVIPHPEFNFQERYHDLVLIQIPSEIPQNIGDSGAPIVYGEYSPYILAGIVSGGYGCGLKEYPGLYIPINKPKYLQWIKDVAFQ